MLAGDFFYITSLEQESGKINAILEINDTHPIFEGHFPRQPVVPGVCMMQMVKEIVESALTIKTTLVSAGQMKFLTILDPTENNSIHAAIQYTLEEDGNIKLVASLVNDEVIYFKMNGILALLIR